MLSLRTVLYERMTSGLGCNCKLRFLNSLYVKCVNQTRVKAISSQYVCVLDETAEPLPEVCKRKSNVAEPLWQAAATYCAVERLLVADNCDKTDPVRYFEWQTYAVVSLHELLLCAYAAR